MEPVRMSGAAKGAWGAAMVAAPAIAILLFLVAVSGSVDQSQGLLPDLLVALGSVALAAGLAGVVGFPLYLSKRLGLPEKTEQRWRALVFWSGGLAMPIAYFRLVWPLPR